jgi:beta-phosphoglucomutase-like phosphatase (HAD superfamily)
VIRTRLRGRTTLFFDLDGTLTDIDQRETEVIYDTANHFGLRVSRTEVKQLCMEMPSYFDVFKKLGLELTDNIEQYWASAFVKAYRFSVVKRGVESTLKALSKKYTLVCVTSRATLAEVIRELRFLGINRFFRHVVTRDVAAKHFGLTSLPFLPFHEQRKKLYQCTLEIVKSSPKKTVVIGDMRSELKPAKDLGMTTIGLIAHKARKKELQETSDFLISNITQLQNILFEPHESRAEEKGCAR